MLQKSMVCRRFLVDSSSSSWWWILGIMHVVMAPNLKLGTLCVTTPGGQESISEIDQPAAVQLAVEHATAQGVLQGWNISLHNEDITQMRDVTTAGGVSADSVATNIAQRLNSAGVVAAVGAGYSSEAMQLAPALATHDIVLISQSATADTLSNSTTYPFFGRTVPADSSQVWSNCIEPPL